MLGPFHYLLFGLHIRSEIELPELSLIEPDGPADVEIVLGALPTIGNRTTDYQVGEDGSGFAIERVAKYWVSDGRRMIVDPHPEAPCRNVRLYLLGSAMAILIHQRGLLPLHANAIDVGNFAIAFIGHSGAGKSTLAAAFHDAGYDVLADDVSVVSFLGDRPIVFPGIPRLRLSEGAIEASGRDNSCFDLSYEGDRDFRKFDVPIEGGRKPLPLRAIYKLSEGRLALEKLTGAAAVEAIITNTYRGEFIRLGGLPLIHWKASVRLSQLLPLYDFRRVRAFDQLSNQVAAIVGHASELPA